MGMRGLAVLCVALAAALGAAGPAPEPALTQTVATGVLGRMVHDADGVEIGRIVDVVVDPAGQPRAVVIDTGGFMGVGSRAVAVSWAAVHVPPPDAADMHVGIDLTDAQVRAAPDYTDRSKPAVVVGPPPAVEAPALEAGEPAPAAALAGPQAAGTPAAERTK